MRYRTETPTGNPSWDISVCLNSEAAREFLEYKACLTQTGAFTTESWMLSQMIMNGYQRNKIRKTFSALCAEGSTLALAALEDMERMKCLPPEYEPALASLRKARDQATGGPPGDR